MLIKLKKLQVYMERKNDNIKSDKINTLEEIFIKGQVYKDNSSLKSHIIC